MIIDLPDTTTAAVNQQARRPAGHRRRGRARPGHDPDHRHRRRTGRGGHPRRQRRQPRAPVPGHRGRPRQQARGSNRLDAQIRVGGDAGASEVIVLRLYGPLAEHGDSVVVPLLLPDAPDRRLVAGRRPRGARARTRSAGWRSAGSPTPRRAKNPVKALQQRAAGTTPGRHRPGLDPDHPVARPARRRAGPAAVRAGHAGRRSRAARTAPAPTCSPPGSRLYLKCPVTPRAHAGRAPAWSASAWSGSPGPIELVRPGRQRRHPDPARPAGAADRAARRAGPRLPGRGAAPARPGRRLRRGRHPRARAAGEDGVAGPQAAAADAERPAAAAEAVAGHARTTAAVRASRRGRRPRQAAATAKAPAGQEGREEGSTRRRSAAGPA